MRPKFHPLTVLVILLSAILLFTLPSNAQADDLQWVGASKGKVPSNSVKGGAENNQKLYICRAKHNGGVHPGKIVGGNCNIGWGGKEITIPS